MIHLLRSAAATRDSRALRADVHPYWDEIPARSLAANCLRLSTKSCAFLSTMPADNFSISCRILELPCLATLVRPSPLVRATRIGGYAHFGRLGAYLTCLIRIANHLLSWSRARSDGSSDEGYCAPDCHCVCRRIPQLFHQKADPRGRVDIVLMDAIVITVAVVTSLWSGSASCWPSVKVLPTSHI